MRMQVKCKELESNREEYKRLSQRLDTISEELDSVISDLDLDIKNRNRIGSRLKSAYDDLSENAQTLYDVQKFILEANKMYEEAENR